MDFNAEQALLDAPALVRRLYGARVAARPDPPPGETPPQRLERLRAQLSAVELQVLAALSIDHNQTVAAIAERLHLKPATVSHALGALKDAELIGDLPLPGAHHRHRSRPLTQAGQRRARDLFAQANRILRDTDPTSA